MNIKLLTLLLLLLLLLVFGTGGGMILVILLLVDETDFLELPDPPDPNLGAAPIPMLYIYSK